MHPTQHPAEGVRYVSIQRPPTHRYAGSMHDGMDSHATHLYRSRSPMPLMIVQYGAYQIDYEQQLLQLSHYL